MPQKFTTFFNLLDALREPGCALCRLVEKGTRQHFDSMLYEYVNDPKTRAALAASQGFCREHARVLLSFGDALGTALLHQGLLRMLAEPDRAPKGHISVPSASCPACDYAKDLLERYGSTLLDFLGEQEILEALEHPGVLCLPHLRWLIVHSHDKESANALVACARRTARQILDRLDRFIAAQNATGPPISLSEEDTTAWLEALDFFSGTLREPITR